MKSCQKKLARHYGSYFTDIMMYTSDKEPSRRALHEIYVPMIWKHAQDPESTRNDVEINSPFALFEQVQPFKLYYTTDTYSQYPLYITVHDFV